MEVNFAENDRRLQDNPTDQDCFLQGQTHFHYGWSRRPWGHWSDEQKAAYDRGYFAAQEGK